MRTRADIESSHKPFEALQLEVLLDIRDNQEKIIKALKGPKKKRGNNGKQKT